MGKKKASKFIDRVERIPRSNESNHFSFEYTKERDTTYGSDDSDTGDDCIDDDEKNENESKYPSATLKSSISVSMWEFGQNDPKRDSGSKLCRLGYATTIKIGQSFHGIVLSSESKTCISKKDRDILIMHGIAGINCSWNRLEEIPFHKLGKSRNQRVLPILVAANTVNYGKPFKMNTAEAMAAALYICDFKEDARILLSSFSYGPEFLRLNCQLLEAYSNCESSDDVLKIQEEYLIASTTWKENRIKEKESRNHSSYIDESDLPPIISDEEEYDDDDDDDDDNEHEKEHQNDEDPSLSFVTKDKIFKTTELALELESKSDLKS